MKRAGWHGGSSSFTVVMRRRWTPRSIRLYGTLTITGNSRGYPVRHVFEDCNPNILWSDDSKMLAFSQRTREQGLRLLLISLPRGQTQCISRRFVCLELHSFAGGIIRGIDGAQYFPMKFEVDVSQAFHPLDPGVR